MSNNIHDCKGFRESMQSYLDSELNAAGRESMNAHITSCPDCAEELDRMTQLLTLCAELDEGLVMPLSAKDSWRRAVRELSARKKPAMSGFARWASLAAAALMMLAIGTQSLRQQGAFLSDDPATGTARLSYNNIAEGQYLDDGDYETQSSRGIADGGSAISIETDQSTGLGEIQNYTNNSVGATQGQPMLIRSAERTIESDNFEADLKELQDIIKEYDGRTASSNIYEPSAIDERTQPLRSAYIVLRVPEERLDDFLFAMDDIGKVTSRKDYSEDVSGRYRDTQARKASLSAQLARLDELTQTAATVEELILIDEKSREISDEIDSLDRAMQGWDDQVEYSRVTLYVSEVTTRDMVKPEEMSLNERIATSFWDSVEWLKAFCQDALVVLAMAGPQLVIWIPALVLAVLILRFIVRRIRR